MMRIAALVLVATTVSVFAADKAPTKPTGTWERSSSEHKLAFTFNDDGTMKLSVDVGGRKIDISGEYGITKDGTIYGVMTKVVKDIDEGPDKGDLIGFNYSIKDKELTISELRGSKMNEGAKKIVEGTYTKK